MHDPNGLTVEMTPPSLTPGQTPDRPAGPPPWATSRGRALDEVCRERAYQARKYPNSARVGCPAGHALPGWLSLIRHYAGRAERAWAANPSGEAAKAEVRKVTALGLACLEQYGCPPRRAADQRQPAPPFPNVGSRCTPKADHHRCAGIVGSVAAVLPAGTAGVQDPMGVLAIVLDGELTVMDAARHWEAA